MNKITKLIAIALSSILFLSGCGSGTSSGKGKKIGQIVKIGHHGLFCGTYEAELIRGGFNGGSGVNGSSLNFTIKNKKLYDQLVISMENQQEIELTYDMRALYGFCYSDTGIIATDFKVVKKKMDSEENESKSDRKIKEKMLKELNEVSFDEEDTLVVNP